ncbi:hypothetical protein [Acinetobacter geminorum]|uniref:hypothetical protein n=1 Tax=Acinetobacter geminorum TaxID=2730922 RepID=UPI003AF91997
MNESELLAQFDTETALELQIDRLQVEISELMTCVRDCSNPDHPLQQRLLRVVRGRTLRLKELESDLRELRHEKTAI